MAGDNVVREISEILSRNVRRTDSVARMGGEEFASLGTGDGTARGMRHVREPAPDDGSASFVEELQTIQVTASVGVVAKEPNESLQDMMARADQALYAAKREGRNRVIPDVNLGQGTMTNSSAPDSRRFGCVTGEPLQ
jgi:diguanylate cyclase (GGDEF)-like protein